MKHAAALSVLAIALSVMCGTVEAQVQMGYTAKSASLRAGPARDYPVVAVLAPGVQVAVQGCLSDYRWCDVIVGYNRGWLYAGNINYPYQNRYVPLMTVGSVVGLTVLGFALNDYWGQHYHNRRFYNERHRWEGHPVPGPGAHFGPRPVPHQGFVGPRPVPQQGFVGPRHDGGPNRPHPQAVVPPQHQQRNVQPPQQRQQRTVQPPQQHQQRTVQPPQQRQQQQHQQPQRQPRQQYIPGNAKPQSDTKG